MPGAHSFLPPSGAADWSRCALWPTMNARYPQDDSPASVEGTAAHWVLSEMASGHSPKEGELSPNGIMVTGEMLDGAELACDVIDRWRLATSQPLHSEEAVSIPAIHPDCFGTPDLWTFDLSDCHLRILDYKYGHGFVDEQWNPQGILYALGILEQIKPQLIGSPLYVKVSFTIVQPRCYYQGDPVRTQTYQVKDLEEHIGRLKVAAHLATFPEPSATTGPQCEHCPGRHACPTLQKAAYHDAEFASDRQPHDLSPAAAALELRMLERAYERLGARVDGLKELTLANLRAGKVVPHYRVEAGKGRRQWNIPNDQLITIGQMLGKDLRKVTVITPTQAEKIIDGSVISKLSLVIPGSHKLVAENNADALRVFGRGE